MKDYFGDNEKKAEPATGSAANTTSGIAGQVGSRILEKLVEQATSQNSLVPAEAHAIEETAASYAPTSPIEALTDNLPPLPTKEELADDLNAVLGKGIHFTSKEEAKKAAEYAGNELIDKFKSRIVGSGDNPLYNGIEKATSRIFGKPSNYLEKIFMEGAAIAAVYYLAKRALEPNRRK